MLKGKKNVNKTVKHCAVCQENFGDRFSFCPVCGEPLKAVEQGQNEAFAAAGVRENAEIQREEIAAVTAAPLHSVEGTAQFNREPAVESTNGAAKFEENLPKKTPAAKPVVTQARRAPGNAHRVVRGEYHLTMLQPPKNYGRMVMSGAMLGLVLSLTAVVGLLIYDIFAYPLDVAAVDEGSILYSVYPNDEKPFEEEKEPERKNDDDGGGGGGGGRGDVKPPSKGVDAPQSPLPQQVSPSVNIPRLENPELKIQATTVGPVETKREDGPYGIRSSTSLDPSDGPGRGGGQGTGQGTGQGGGIGTGIGNGIGSGRGNGRGNGIGDGEGDGQNRAPEPVKPPAGPAVEKLNIIAKPRASYTDEARKNQVQGTVRLRVTFSASGQITGVSAINGLPNGLTEQAIAAARQIRFTPEKRNGSAVSVVKTIEYNFNLY
jgi:periplasmic protein TonB